MALDHRGQLHGACAALDRKLSITDVFRFPTIRALAAFAERGPEAGSGGGSPVAAGTGRADARRAAMVRRAAPNLVSSGAA